MRLEMLKSKIHRVVVTQSELDYVGSVTIDEELMEAAGILEYEKVLIVDIDNGNRFETYTIAGKKGSGVICLNGAAARCVDVNDKVIIMAFCTVEASEAKEHKPVVVFVNEDNSIKNVTRYEEHGRLSM